MPPQVVGKNAAGCRRVRAPLQEGTRPVAALEVRLDVGQAQLGAARRLPLPHVPRLAALPDAPPRRAQQPRCLRVERQRHLPLPVPQVVSAKVASRLGLLLVHFLQHFDLKNSTQILACSLFCGNFISEFHPKWTLYFNRKGGQILAS